MDDPIAIAAVKKDKADAVLQANQDLADVQTQPIEAFADAGPDGSGGWFAGVGEWLVGAWEDTISWIGGTWDTTVAWVGDTATGIGEWFGGVWEDTVSWVSGSWDASMAWVGDTASSIGDFAEGYWYYLWHPSEMDGDLQAVQNFFFGLSAGAATAAVVLVGAPALAAGLVTAGLSEATATGLVTAGLYGLGAYGGLNLGWTSIEAYQDGDWNELSFNAGLFVGGMLGASGARSRLANGLPGAEPTQAPPLWDVIGTFRYEWSLRYRLRYNGKVSLPGLSWFGTAPTPASGAGATALGTGVWDPPTWLGELNDSLFK